MATTSRKWPDAGYMKVGEAKEYLKYIKSHSEAHNYLVTQPFFSSTIKAWLEKKSCVVPSEVTFTGGVEFFLSRAPLDGSKKDTGFLLTGFLKDANSAVVDALIEYIKVWQYIKLLLLADSQKDIAAQYNHLLKQKAAERERGRGRRSSQSPVPRNPAASLSAGTGVRPQSQEGRRPSIGGASAAPAKLRVEKHTSAGFTGVPPGMMSSSTSSFRHSLRNAGSQPAPPPVEQRASPVRRFKPRNVMSTLRGWVRGN